MKRNVFNPRDLVLIVFLSTTSLHCSFADTNKEEFEIPLTEDLMQEHGILNRVLLIYEEIIRRIDQGSDFPIVMLNKAAGIIKLFIEDHHEKLEEDYIFPLFEKNEKEVNLVKTLRVQHNKGREIIAALQEISAIKGPLDQRGRKTVKSLLQKFITMYRPHEARENTILFPQIRFLMSEQEFEELGETFEELEHKLFGHNGFEETVKKVARIEKELGIYHLEQFTPMMEKNTQKIGVRKKKKMMPLRIMLKHIRMNRPQRMF